MTKQEAKKLALASIHEARMKQLGDESDRIAYVLGEYLLAQIAVNLADACSEDGDELIGFNEDGTLNEEGFEIAFEAIRFHADDETMRHTLENYREELTDFYR